MGKERNTGGKKSEVTGKPAGKNFALQVMFATTKSFNKTK